MPVSSTALVCCIDRIKNSDWGWLLTGIDLTKAGPQDDCIYMIIFLEPVIFQCILK
jgi:hypothetical protein